MAILQLIVFVLVCVLAAYPLLVAKQPNTKDVLDKLVPYQAIIGLVAMILAIVALFDMLLYLAAVLSHALGLIALIAALIELALGFLLAFPLLNEHVFKSGGGAEAARAKVAAYQIPLAVVGLVIAALWILLWIFA